MSDMILELNQVEKSYPDFHLNVSFGLPKGVIMGLIGENGAGKSTTIKLILDLIRRESGEIKLFGEDNRKTELKQDIGVVFDENNFPETMTPKQIGKILKPIYRNWDSRQYEEYLHRFGLPERKIVKEFSRGMKMKLSLAAAMSHHAKLLILDEPTSGLDPVVRNEILDLFLEFIGDEEHSILLSSHITSDLEHVADYITFLHQGSLVLSTTKDELIYQYGILKGGREEQKLLNPKDYLGIRTNSYGFEALVSDREKAAALYPGMVLDQASLEDIMLLTVKGDQQARGQKK